MLAGVRFFVGQLLILLPNQQHQSAKEINVELSVDVDLRFFGIMT